PAEVEINVFDLPLREILWQQTRPEIRWVVERRTPVYRAQPQVMDLDDIAGLGAAYRDGADDRMRAASGIVLAHLRQPLDCHAGLHLVQEMRPSVRIGDNIAGIDC